MTRPWHPLAHGAIAPVVACLALFGAGLFLFTSVEPSAAPLFVWELLTLAGMTIVVSQRRFRERAGVSAGLFGVVAWVLSAIVFFDLLEGSTLAVVAWLASSLGIALAAAAAAEHPDRMRDTAMPSGQVRGLALTVMIGALLWASRIGVVPDQARVVAPSTTLGFVEIPALPTLVRERLGSAGEEPIDVEVSSVAQPGGSALARVSIARVVPQPDVAARTLEPCEVEVGPLGRTVEVRESEQSFEVRWPISPHGETFGGCAYERASLSRLDDDAVRPARPTSIAWSLVIAPVYGLFVLLLGWRHRRRHARVSRSPEVRVTSPGLAVMPDGSPAVVPSEIPMGTSLVALRIADVRPDYRADARLSIEELELGEKNALLVSLARRIRTLELLALAGTALLVSVVVAVALAGGPLGF
ncbi:MAG: hypothetical protein K1X94_21030 [Sandaracinaceae bacterium]|nr:hypothetical protein [Sandaracinaceae bacterium]